MLLVLVPNAGARHLCVKSRLAKLPLPRTHQSACEGTKDVRSSQVARGKTCRLKAQCFRA